MEQINFDEIKIFIKDIFRLTFESTDYRCLVCDAEISSADEYICESCKDNLSVKHKNTCRVCGRLDNKKHAGTALIIQNHIKKYIQYLNMLNRLTNL